MKSWTCILVLCCFLVTADYGWTQEEIPQIQTQSLEDFSRLGSSPNGGLSLVNRNGESIPLPPTVIVLDFHGEQITKDFPFGALAEVIFFPPAEMRTVNYEENPFAIRAVQLIVE